MPGVQLGMESTARCLWRAYWLLKMLHAGFNPLELDQRFRVPGHVAAGVLGSAVWQATPVRRVSILLCVMNQEALHPAHSRSHTRHAHHACFRKAWLCHCWGAQLRCMAGQTSLQGQQPAIWLTS